MNVLYLAQHQRFSGDTAGFAHVFNITRNLANLGHRVTLVVRSPGRGKEAPGGPAGAGPTLPPGLGVKFVDWELEYPLPFGPAPRLTSQLDITAPARALRWMKRAVREDGIQIVQERHEMRLDMSPLTTRFLGVPSVLEVNSPFIEEAFPEGSFSFSSRNLFRRLGFSSATAIVVQTALLKRIISRHTRTPIHVIPNGADPELFSPDSDNRELAGRLRLGSEVVGFAGAFHPWHGAADLVEAFSHLAPKNPKARLLMVGGGGEDLERCRALARRRGIADRVVLTGKVPYTELPLYLGLCSVLAAPFSPSKDLQRRAVFEKYGLWWCPLKLFEYMAMGRPVVASSVGVIPEYIEGSGELYPEGDTRALSEKLQLLLSDGELRERLGRAGRQRIENRYNWRNVAAETARLYESILGAGLGPLPKTL